MGTACFLPTGTLTQLTAWTSTTSAAFPTPPNNGAYNELNMGAAAPGGTPTLPTGTMRLSLASTTTVYLSGNCNFSTGTCTAFGFIGARRRR